ncbi:hypothetical protein SLS62_009315 [Diatrype stigma]|uniref:J domain-containing protein n=1 Tax=Diatrype stigma TaxID=117547 RepID=A0AAN9UM03_9PEZI
MFTLPPDPYKALGVPKDAQNPEIKAAYRKLVLKCHPDKVQDPQLKAEKQAEFQLVHQAYELLIDDISRDKYDEKVRYNEKFSELEREREKAKMSSSAPTNGRTPRTPSRSRGYYEPEIRTAEPRPSTFKTGTPPSSRKFYEAGHTSSHSWEDDLGSSSKPYDDTRRFKKSASYERERDREWEREREHEKEREKEREREKLERRKRREKEAEEQARESAREREREREQRDRAKQEQKAAKEAEEAKEAKKKKERRDKDKDKKKVDKERKRETEDKHRRKSPYVEPYHEDSDVEDATAHVFEKSSSRKSEEEDTHPTMTTDRERKNSANLEFAARYLERSGAKPANLSRSPTFQDGPSYSVRHVAPMAVPTPPPATASAHPPPPPPARDTRDIDVEEDTPRRSSGRSGRTKPPDALRSSTKESRDKSSHRKSGTRSASRDAAARPTVVEVAPGVNRIPGLQKSYSDPHRVVQLNRSYTDYSSPRPGPRPVPGMERQNTWQQGDDRGRGRGRHVHAHSEESEDDVLHHPSWRTQSPEPLVGATRYTVADGKTRRKVPVEAMPIPPRGHKVRHVAANTSSPRADPGAAGYHPEAYGEAPVHAAFSSVKYAAVVQPEEVAYSGLPRYSSSYTKDPYSTPVY